MSEVIPEAAERRGRGTRARISKGEACPFLREQIPQPEICRDAVCRKISRPALRVVNESSRAETPANLVGNFGAAARSLAVGVLTVAALVGSVIWLDQHYPLRGWLVWTVATIWGWQFFLAASMVAIGHVVVSRVLGIRCSSVLQRLTFAAPVGAVTFAMGLFAAGFAGILSAQFAILWPALMLVVAVLSERGQVVRAWLPSQSRAPGGQGLAGLAGLVATGFGLLGVGLIYLQNLSPESMTYDANWTHLAIAQDYAREGRIVPFLADWPKNLPHLGSVINTWSFLVPGLDAPAAKYMMALHTEFVFFLWTLVGVAAGMERLGAKARGGWATVFLFPALFVYDHCLGGGADHFLAFFAVPVFLALLDTVQTLNIRSWALLAIVTSGAVLTKFQAVFLVAPAVLILVAVVLLVLVKRARAKNRLRIRRLLAGPAIAILVALVLTAPHFVKNWIYYGNPLFPFGQQIFKASHPTLPDAALLADNMLKNWGSHPPALLWPHVKSFLEAATNFPCHPHIPESGTLFAVALLLTPLLPRARRLWFGLLVCCASLLVWCCTYMQGRNLQGVLPLFAVVTGAFLVRAFRLGRVARFGVGALVLVQAVAGLDSFFVNPERIANAVSLIRSTRDGRAANRFDNCQRSFIELGQSLPKKAVVLLHSEHLNLGIDRPILHDWLGFQSLIDHRKFHNVRDMYLALKALGVTHIVYRPGIHSAETRQNEAVFAAFASAYKDRARDFGQLRLLTMPDEPPPDEPTYEVLLLGMGSQPDGLYAVDDLAALEEMPEKLQRRRPPTVPLADAAVATLLPSARVVLLGRDVSLASADQQILAAQFDVFTSYSDFSVRVRRP
jgi:hypothetical protein